MLIKNINTFILNFFTIYKKLMKPTAIALKSYISEYLSFIYDLFNRKKILRKDKFNITDIVLCN